MGNAVTFSTPLSARAAAAILLIIATAACARSGKTPADSSSTSAGASDSTLATPVHMAVVQRGTIAVTVSGPGQTNAFDLQKIRAPFTGTLTSLRAVIGERVSSGEVIGSIVTQPSQAALAGAQAMLAAARTASERSDAKRAIALAHQNMIATPLRVPRGGMVVSRSASQGDLLSAGDSIVSIAAAGSIAFIARIAQGDLGQIRPGQRATILFPGQVTPATGVVRGLLPADTTGGMTVPLRIDLRGAPHAAGAPVQTGLFGTAQIVVGEHSGVTIVPATAVLRDDITGISRVATVTHDGKAHWVTVQTGATQGDRVEIMSPPLSPGQRVIVSGQVGLPEGSPVREDATGVVLQDSVSGSAQSPAPAQGPAMPPGK